MTIPEEPKPPMALSVKVLIAIFAVGVLCIVVGTVLAFFQTSSNNDEYDQNAQPEAIATPTATTTKEPLVAFKPSDYPCSKNLYLERNRIQEGTELYADDPYDPQDLPADTTAYCKKVKAAVDALPSMKAKVNHLVVEYCKSVADTQDDNGSNQEPSESSKQINLEDIYGSLYGTVMVTYDKESDTYTEKWIQRATNGEPAYFQAGVPSLLPLVNKYCPQSSTDTATGL